VERPEKTIFVLVTDLCEGGNADQLVARMRALHESRVRCLVLLALHDGGKPSFDHDLAARIAAIGIRPFGSTPNRLVQVVEAIMKGADPAPLCTENA
jgi:hypothetical protein